MQTFRDYTSAMLDRAITEISAIPFSGGVPGLAPFVVRDKQPTVQMLATVAFQLGASVAMARMEQADLRPSDAHDIAKLSAIRILRDVQKQLNERTAVESDGVR